MDQLNNLNLEKIAHNTVSQLATRSIATFASFASIFIITYFQGFELLGAVTKVTAFVTFFYLLTDFGLNAMFIKYYFKNTETYIGNLVMLRLGISLLLAVATVLIASILPYDPFQQTGYSVSEKIGIAIFSITLITQGTLLSLTSLLQKKLKFHLAILPSVLGSFVLLTVIFLGAKIGNLHIVLSSYVLAQVIYITLLYKKLKKAYHINLRTEKLKEFSYLLLKLSLPLGLVLVLNTILAKSDQIILALLTSNFDVGVYSFAYKIFDFLIIVPAFMSTSIYPILLQKNSSGSITDSVVKYSAILVCLSIAATVITFAAAPLLKFIRGDFSLSVAPLQILSLSLPFFFLTSLFQWVMITKGKLKALAVIYGSGMIISILLNVTYVPEFSYFATSVTTVITEGLIFLLMIIYFGIQKTKIFQNQI